MTIGNIIDKARIQLRLQSDDALEEWPDELIYSHLIDIRALLVERDLDKYKRITMAYWMSFCMPLENVKEDCDGCLDNDCYVLESTYTLPGTLGNSFVDMLKVYSIAGNQVYPGGYQKWKREQNSMTNKNRIYYDIYNNKLRLYGTNVMKVVTVRMVPEDPMDLMGISLCDADGNELEGTCFDPLTEDFPIDRSLVTYAIEFLVKRIGSGTAIKEDISNDAQSDPKAPRPSYSNNATPSE